MTSFGGNKVAVIKAVRAITGLGLKEAKDAVEGAPSDVALRKALLKTKQKILSRFLSNSKKLGASVELK